MNDTLILVAVFVAVLILIFTIANALTRSRDIRRNLDQVSVEQQQRDARSDEVFGSENENIRHYYEVMRRNDPEGLDMRLIRAGYFSPDAKRSFQLIRLAVTVAVFALVWYLLVNLSEGLSSAMALVLAGLASGIVFILVSAVLDRQAKKNQTAYRRLFPDFMDLLVVCVDSGMSIEAAIDRVAHEFLHTKPSFGQHLSIISLEVRAGRPMHEALNNFATRIQLDEARTLSVLFRQSMELGSSVIKTLRVFSKEMRQTRIIKAEEKANALPVKMLFPMAGFLFPVNLIIVLVPIMMQIMKLFSTMTPGGN
ncbi:MAG: type II secretion system F family protein [Rhodobacterales bacterium]|jgi:tight adherence protein C|nr:type II secretion system F family protein [Rhodobacterales bacterium]MDX5388891.1 type II secretion system F family protein [Rhodobacterales bacterium]MDX5488580.1 type II secretion system F family protein [Rhodobacterales bacterium]